MDKGAGSPGEQSGRRGQLDGAEVLGGRSGDGEQRGLGVGLSGVGVWIGVGAVRGQGAGGLDKRGGGGSFRLKIDRYLSVVLDWGARLIRACMNQS